MLTQLLRSDNIAYTIRPVLNCDEVVHTYNTFVTEDIKSIFMINCGAVCDLYLYYFFIHTHCLLNIYIYMLFMIV